VAWLSYLNEHTRDDVQHGYVHVAHAPPGGGRVEADHWSREVRTEAAPERGPDAYCFELPGCANIDERTISVRLPEVEADLALDGPLLPYFPEPDSEASPFLGPGAAPGGSSHWFVRTLGTPATWRWEDATGLREGRGLLYAERGWSVRQAHGFCYVMAVSEPAKVVLTCGMGEDGGRVWAGRVLTAEHDLTFLPFTGDVTVTSDIDQDAARVAVAFTRDGLEARVVAEAPLEEFYDQITPSLTVFHAEHPVAKTMQARLRLQVLRDGDVVESVELPQSIFELGGVLHPPGLSVARPTYGY
jgi:hypothetical protein